MFHQMTPPKSCSTYKINGKTFPVKEQVVIIHNLSNNHDITTAVEALMKNDALSKSSSIFVLVPVSDDEEDDNLSCDLGSTIGIQLPNNYTTRKIANELEYGMPLRRPLSCNVKPAKYENEVLEIVLSSTSAPKHMKISNKLCQITTPYKVTNKLCQITTPCDVTNKLCQITTPQPVPNKHQRHTRFAGNTLNKQANNKICQVTSPPSQIINKMTFVVGTDTTIDRPCCCEVGSIDEVTTDKLCCCLDTRRSSNRTKRIIINRSQLISPVLVKTEFSAEEFPKKSSVLESDKRFASISPETDNYIADPIFDMKQRYIYNTPISELEENSKSALKSCQCTPEKLRLLLEQVLAEKSLKKTNVCCGSPMDPFGAPKHIHLIDMKCSGCMLPSQKNATNKHESNRAMDCHCEELFTGTDTSPVIQKIASSTLFCLDDPTKIQDIPKSSLNADDTVNKLSCITKHTTLPYRNVLTRPDLDSQSIEVDGRELYSAIEGTSTYNEPSRQRGHNVMIDTNTFKNERGQNNKLKLAPKARPYYGNMSIRSKTKDQIKADLIQALSGFKYLQEVEPPKPMVSFVTDNVITKSCIKYPPSNALTHLHNMSINTDKRYPLKSNVVRTISSLKYPQKEPSSTHKFKVTIEDFLRYYANMKTGQLSVPPSSNKKSANNPLKFNDKQSVKTGHLSTLPGNPKDRKVKEDYGLKLRYDGKSSHSKTPLK